MRDALQPGSDPFDVVAEAAATFVEDLPRVVDVVIVGAGAAGSVLAARLSEDPARRVLLLEAGSTTGAEQASRVPGMAFGLLTGENAWPDMTEPQAGLGGRQVYLAQGRGLGGGSSMNMMAWFRGHPADYDGWAAAGAAGWSWRDVADGFDRIEEREPHTGRAPQHAGVVAVTSPRDVSALPLTFLGGARAAGLPITSDFNGDVREGAGLFSANIREGQRDSVVTAYLAPALARPNLFVRTGVQVSRLLLDGARARGVLARTAGGVIEVEAERVVVTAGAIRTPQLLLLSGIGGAEQLRGAGIEVVVDSPDVGRNLQDHPLITPLWAVTDGSPLANAVSAADRAAYETARRGPLASLSQAGAVLRTRDDLAAPDLQLTLTLLGLDAQGALIPDPVVTAALSVLAPTSRGSVSLRPGDPEGRPVVDPRYLSTEEDMATFRAGIRRVGEIFRAGPLADAIGEALSVPDSASDEELDAFIRGNAATEWHPAGTCRMGTDRDAVVDSGTFLARGTENVYVADSSVMPTVTRGNIQAPVVMIAERAAARI